MDENQIILSPKRDQNCGESGFSEIVFRLLYIHHHTPLQLALPGPTANHEVGSATFIGRSTFFVDLGSIFFIYFCAREYE